MKSFKLLTSMKWSLFFFLSLKASTEKLTVEEKAYSTLMQNLLIHYFCWSLHPLKKYSCIFFKSSMFPSQKNECIFLRMTEKC